MSRKTKAMLEAELEVTRAALEDAMRQLKDATRKLMQLEGQADDVEKDVQLITTRKHLLHKCRSLAAKGVPCYVQGNYLKHRVTGAVIAQMKE